jgi:ssDNA-binding replication factor A large subunit
MKSERKKWSNSKGEGQLFSVNLMDETGEIKATAFNAAVDYLYDRLEEGKVRLVQSARSGYSQTLPHFRSTISQKERSYLPKRPSPHCPMTMR